jgi:predicted RNase H-like nuclease (RuvC/YqgF family)
VTYGFGFMIESLVAILLMLTIAYCVILNNRLKRLKADEQSLKATIAELITATEIAERAVAGLKTTAHECDHTLGERLRTADHCCAELNLQIKAGDALIKRLSRILAAARPGEGEAEPAGAPDPKAVAAAAQAFAERARTRLGSLAA